MAIRKFTTLELRDDARVIATQASSSMSRVAKLSDFQFTPRPGFLYVTTRAISSRVNANYDGWPSEELRNAYLTFIGRPVYVDHNNWDLERSRGVIIDSKLWENKLSSGHEDVWIELLIEVDAQAFPKLAQALIPDENGDADIDAVSMGADVEYTICSVCGNKARDIMQYCGHIPQLKGRHIDVLDHVAGKQIKKLCYEDCFGVSFFEISFVFDPADESALISDVMLASAGNRSLAHIRQQDETVTDYSRRLGTSLAKISSVQTLDFCDSCGSEDITITKIGSHCNTCQIPRYSDKALMTLPQQVDTLRDEMNCPQCGSEWNGMVCQNCGFELPPEGLGDPNTQMGMGMNMPEGAPEGGDQQEEEDGASDSPPPKKSDEKDDSAKKSPEKSDKKDDSEKKNPKKDDSSKKSPEKKDDKKDDKKEKDDDKKAPTKAKDKKKSGREDFSVSRFDEIQKEATLPETIPYRQDTSPAQSVGPYGTSYPGGTPVNGVEPALEPAPEAQAEVQDLDAQDVVAPVGQSAVTVPAEQPGPSNVPPPGVQVGESLNGRGASKADKKKEFLLARAATLREKAEEFEKRAEQVYQTDVRDLDSPPPVDVGPDAHADVLKATDEQEQLMLADTPDRINDGTETGLPDVSERLKGQYNPFTWDPAMEGYQPVQQQVASVEPIEAAVEVEAARCKAGCECPDGSCDCGPCSASSKNAAVHIDQRIAAAKTRVLRIANFVDERIEQGLTNPGEKFAEIAKFEEMDDATLDGFIQATREFKAKELKVANKRIRVASTNDGGPIRMPSLGSVSRPVEDFDDDPADDYVTFLS